MCAAEGMEFVFGYCSVAVVCIKIFCNHHVYLVVCAVEGFNQMQSVRVAQINGHALPSKWYAAQ